MLSITLRCLHCKVLQSLSLVALAGCLRHGPTVCNLKRGPWQNCCDHFFWLRSAPCECAVVTLFDRSAAELQQLCCSIPTYLLGCVQHSRKNAISQSHFPSFCADRTPFVTALASTCKLQITLLCDNNPVIIQLQAQQAQGL